LHSLDWGRRIKLEAKGKESEIGIGATSYEWCRSILDFFSPFFNIVSPLHITSYEKEGYGTTERLGGQGTDRQVMGSGLLERTGFSPHSLLLRW